MALPVDIRPILGLLPLQNRTTLNRLLTAGLLANTIKLKLKGLYHSLKYYGNETWL